jgi:hypothetical protein
MANWAVPAFDRSRVDWAGAKLLDALISEDDLEEAIAIINNWRSSHSFPLNTFQLTLRRNARQVSHSPTIAQRIKRLSSIRSKLRRFKWLTLSGMQDLGGCRAVVGSVNAVRRLVRLYKASDLRHTLADEDDYISEPKRSGYRGAHLIYRYYSEKNPVYNGLQIEMQFRSPYQHAWATAVETVDTFTRQALKSGGGESDWRRFFKLMGTAIAKHERCPIVSDTPTKKKDLVAELRTLNARLGATDRLQAYGATLERVERSGRRAHFFLLQLERGDPPRLTVTGFQAKQLLEAQDRYAAAERAIQPKSGGDAVLVSVESLAALSRAYPNYYLDTTVFVNTVRRVIQ